MAAGFALLGVADGAYNFYVGPFQVRKEVNLSYAAEYSLAICADSLDELIQQQGVGSEPDSTAATSKGSFLLAAIDENLGYAREELAESPNIPGSGVYVKSHALALDLADTIRDFGPLARARGSVGVALSKSELRILRSRIGQFHSRVIALRTYAIENGP